jgi:energy-coupling factor transporter ATP-binding protein EcfA2
MSDPADATKVRQWAGDVSAWLYGTDHIEIAYGIQFDGTDVERLSPGTRGIVLLLLYLAIDLDDNRPLLIDQPEENLDPKSIFVELVARFRSAKLHRQIIIVTHNANLIVNADADQVIVASCGPHRPGELPKISYIAGGLEDPTIRASVCDILEGGEHAFRERAKRLRVHL